MSLESKVKRFREQKGYSIADLARVSGVSHPYIRQIESGIKRNPSGAVLQRLATALGTTVADLIGSPQGIDEETLGQVPASLVQLAREKGPQIDLRREDIEMLKSIHFRGRRPDTQEDWELIFQFLKRILR